MRIDIGNEPRRRRCMCVQCYMDIQPEDKRIVDKQSYYHIVCYTKELKRHLKWFDRMEKSGLKWRKELKELIKKFGDEIVADAL